MNTLKNNDDMDNCHINRFQDRAHRLGMSMPLYYLVQDKKISIVDAIKRSFDIEVLANDLAFDNPQEKEDFIAMLQSPTAPRGKIMPGQERQYLMQRSKKAQVLLKNCVPSNYYSAKAYQRFVGDNSSWMTIKIFVDHSFINNIEVDLFRLEQQSPASVDEVKEPQFSYGSKTVVNLAGFKRKIKAARNNHNLRFYNMARILGTDVETLKLVENAPNDDIDLSIYWALANFLKIRYTCLDHENRPIDLRTPGPTNRNHLLFELYN